MCSSYGLGGGYPDSVFAPLDEPESRATLAQWMSERAGTAKITGKNAVNLNPIIRAVSDGSRELVMAWWWLWHDSSGPVEFSAFNSRNDKLLRSWKKPFQTRAILPATWYLEKKGRFHLTAGEMFGIAALTNTVTREDGTELTTYSMVTRDAPSGSEAAEYWHRMPLVLPREMHDEWLSLERPGDESLVVKIRHASEEISRELTADKASLSHPTLF